MLHYLHIFLFCTAGCVVFWGLALLWQSDVTQAQCNAYIWVVYLPLSFMIQLTNVKAYRLSTFLRAGERRPKPFSHGKVMSITILLLIVSVILLALVAALDPPKRKRMVYDIYRPKLDRYYCASNTATTALLSLLACFHVILSIICVAAVRNGMEAFKDGMIIKESFVLLYAFSLATVVLNNIGLSIDVTYLFRTCVLSLGISLFAIRLLGSRCARHLLPEFLYKYLINVREVYVKALMPTDHFSSNSAHFKRAHGTGRNIGSSNRVAVLSEFDEDSPLYAVQVPADSSLNDMISALQNPVRRELFKSVAQKAHVSENLDFVLAVLKYKKESEDVLCRHSVGANKDIKASALNIYKTYLAAGSVDEVNISSKTRSSVETQLQKWLPELPMLTNDIAKDCLALDVMKRTELFEQAFKEIRVMLYQNLWHKFRSQETENIAGSVGENIYSVSDI